jgi:hypothetical protein
MSDNPYAPPTARVDDVPLEEPRKRPRQIVLAVQLAAVRYTSAILFIMLYWDEYYSKTQSVSVLLWTQGIGLALIVWLFTMIYLGRNWARMVLAVLFAFGTLTAFNPALWMSSTPMFVKAQILIGVLLSLVILGLLFLPPGREWFRKRAG